MNDPERPEHTLFTEVQRPPASLWVLTAAAFGGGLVFVDLLLGELPGPGLVPLVLAFGLAVLSLAVTTMRTTVTSEEIDVKIWPFGRRTVYLREIEDCEPVTYRPMLDYGGWGLRWTPWAGWAYSMHGKRGVKLQLWSGKKVLIGSQQADALAAVIARLTKQARRSEA